MMILSEHPTIYLKLNWQEWSRYSMPKCVTVCAYITQSDTQSIDADESLVLVVSTIKRANHGNKPC